MSATHMHTRTALRAHIVLPFTAPHPPPAPPLPRPQALDKMQKEWEGAELEVKDYRETKTFIIKVEEQISQMLDDHITMTQSMTFSPYKKPFEERINKWEQQLNLVGTHTCTPSTSACAHTYLPTCLPACLPTRLLICLLACPPSCLPARLPACPPCPPLPCLSAHHQLRLLKPVPPPAIQPPPPRPAPALR